MGIFNEHSSTISDASSSGPAGPAGPRGLQGLQGPAEPRGLQGLQGIPGPRGPRGLPGNSSNVGSADIDMQNKFEILRLKSNPYPIHGDLSKVINYQDTRNIFLRKKRVEKWRQALI